MKSGTGREQGQQPLRLAEQQLDSLYLLGDHLLQLAVLNPIKLPSDPHLRQGEGDDNAAIFERKMQLQHGLNGSLKVFPLDI
ncbi:MAG: hypothetical protein WStaPseu_36840 [Shewanella algae]|uniref:hypothetical protein n=1 Tax=Aeromonas caviae TaxID=648 RepID=UPI002B490A04|nr:hypothetical protein [Aeromonas caviae]